MAGCGFAATRSAGCISAGAGQGSEDGCAANIRPASSGMTNVFSMGYIESGEFNLRRFTVILLVFTTLAVAAEETTDLSIVNRIKAEAFQNSQVMDHLFYLTDVYGPRLTNSPGY